MVKPFENRPYVDFASEYYEKTLDINVVRKIYAHDPLTPFMVAELNPQADLGEHSEGRRRDSLPRCLITLPVGWSPTRKLPRCKSPKKFEEIERMIAFLRGCDALQEAWFRFPVSAQAV